MYTALYPDTVKNYIALALPLDMSVRELALVCPARHAYPETATLITKTYGNCPAWIIHANFTAMALGPPCGGKYMDLYRQKAKKAIRSPLTYLSAGCTAMCRWPVTCFTS